MSSRPDHRESRSRGGLTPRDFVRISGNSSDPGAPTETGFVGSSPVAPGIPTTGAIRVRSQQRQPAGTDVLVKPLWVVLRVLLPLVVSVQGTATAEPEPQEWVRRYAAYLPGTERRDESNPKTVVAVRILTRTPGGFAPVPGATAKYYTTCADPTRLRPDLLASATTDKHGFAYLVGPAPDGDHWLFEAQGLGIVYEFQRFETFTQHQVILPPAVRRHIRIVDLHGHPVRGAPVELYLGCPHSPAARTATTNNNGEILFEGLGSPLDGYLWVQSEGIVFGRYELPPHRFLGQSLPTVVALPGVSARGTVVDPSGKPLGGIILRELSDMRGPVTKTDANGEFVLHGLAEDEGFKLYAPDLPFGWRPSATVQHFDPGVKLRVTLRRDRPVVHGDGEARHTLDVCLTGVASEDERLPKQLSVPLRASRLTDGFTVRAVSDRFWSDQKDARVRVSLSLPPGEYRIVAGGGYSRWNAVERTITFPEAARQGLRTQLCRRQRAPLLPEQQLEVEEARAPHHVLRFRLRDPGGRALPPIWARLAAGEGTTAAEALPDGWCQIRTRVVGPSALLIGDPQHFGSHGDISVPLNLPADKPRVLILGDIAIPSRDADKDAEEPVRRTMRILKPDGSPFGPGEVSLVDWLDDVECAYEDGLLSWPRDSSPIEARVWVDGWLSMALILKRDSPSQTRFPAGRLTGQIRGSDGKPVAAVLYVDWRRYEFNDGRIDVRGMPTGGYTLILGAAGHLGEIRRIHLKEDEVRPFSITLPPRH